MKIKEMREEYLAYLKILNYLKVDKNTYFKSLNTNNKRKYQIREYKVKLKLTQALNGSKPDRLMDLYKIMNDYIPTAIENELKKIKKYRFVKESVDGIFEHTYNNETLELTAYSRQYRSNISKFNQILKFDLETIQLDFVERVGKFYIKYANIAMFIEFENEFDHKSIKDIKSLMDVGIVKESSGNTNYSFFSKEK